jgi:hypothetical protein
MIDYLMRQGYEQPYSLTLLIFQILSALSLPAFYFAGKRYIKDREQLMQEIS